MSSNHLLLHISNLPLFYIYGNKHLNFKAVFIVLFISTERALRVQKKYNLHFVSLKGISY